MQMKDTTKPLLACIPSAKNVKNKEYAYYEVPSPLFHRCTSQLIKDIHVSIKDHKNDLIPFSDYVGPVVLGITFRKVNSLNFEISPFVTNQTSFDQHFVYMSSKASKDIFPTNNSTHFSDRLRR